jgi:2-polyprenyl-3-methyl-5-hydroxy-6-metoxy-1,4-benzoquinol methylase
LDRAVTFSASVAKPVRGGQPVRPCPGCGGVVHDVLYQQRFGHFAAGSITDGYDVVACRTCGMCFASGLPDQTRFSEYYDQSSKYDLGAAGAELSSFDAERFADEARFIAANVGDRTGPVLDIGTATGGLLVALRDLGFTSVHGVEPSPDAARVARETHGLDVVAGDVGAARAWGTQYSVVSLVAVLEHLVDPAAALRDIAGLLAADGLLYLHVPDAARFDDDVDAPYQQFSVEHINYFTAASLRNLLASVGLEVAAQRAIVVKLSDLAEGPALEVLCRRTARHLAVDRDLEGVAALRRYIARSDEKEATVLVKISELAEVQNPIYVWGTGTHALHLLATSRLAECNIVGFIDSNPHYSGRQLAGRTVLDPRAVGKPGGPILVASAVSQTAIANSARRLFGPDVPLILLYGVADGPD